MECTKAMECTEVAWEIIKHFQDDFSTLYSCFQVNKLWSRLTIPFIWEDPFSFKQPKNYNYIEAYLCNLNDDDKKKLNKYEINTNLFSYALFNYSSFIRHLDTNKLINSIKKWDAIVNPIRQKGLVKFIYKSLIKLFVESDANLLTLDFTYNRNYYNITISQIILNPNFICNIRKLYLKFDTYDTFNIDSFLKSLSLNSKSISSINFQFIDPYQNVEENLINIINSQKNLENISFNFDSLPLYNSLKNPDFINTLRTIIFYFIDFKNIVALNEVFEQLNVLESIHILCCSFLDSIFVTYPFKLRSLFVSEIIIEPIRLLLQNSGNYLENFGLELYCLPRGEVELLDLIINHYSTNIKFLTFCEFNHDSIYKILKLIEKVKLSLNYLTIEISPIANSGSIILQNLWKILPSRLEYLNLIIPISNISDFEFFLKNLQTIFIKKLLIKCVCTVTRIPVFQRNSILHYIKEYIMKNKRVEYLAFLEYFSDKEEYDDLISMENEEFGSYNIVIQKYHELKIDNHEFVSEMYC
ncbi:hypothetical protein RhiirA1_542323 [Rhizophagus irregularis]|uniref:F-box domain-containing protein n=2 Tax=Rhizophagus irregularis TaxID=588596 RepID=A0A2N0QXY4_9GLOM|nr:hypothetical protein RhiirA1_542323 [Rhizophagus irregularis]